MGRKRVETYFGKKGQGRDVSLSIEKERGRGERGGGESGRNAHIHTHHSVEPHLFFLPCAVYHCFAADHSRQEPVGSNTPGRLAGCPVTGWPRRDLGGRRGPFGFAPM